MEVSHRPKQVYTKFDVLSIVETGKRSALVGAFVTGINEA
jgi:hypothetical protein